MGNIFDDMRSAVRDAKQTLLAADNVAGDLAWLLCGRLRRVASIHTLRALKKELRNFDMTTGKWKEPKQ